MIYGGVIHNRCHRLCVFFCQATDGCGEKKKGVKKPPRWRSCKLMERQVRAATLDNFASARFMAVVKKRKRKVAPGTKRSSNTELRRPFFLNQEF